VSYSIQLFISLLLLTLLLLFFIVSPTSSPLPELTQSSHIVPSQPLPSPVTAPSPLPPSPVTAPSPVPSILPPKRPPVSKGKATAEPKKGRAPRATSSKDASKSIHYSFFNHSDISNKSTLLLLGPKKKRGRLQARAYQSLDCFILSTFLIHPLAEHLSPERRKRSRENASPEYTEDMIEKGDII
jgi:hypothetical protein